jgi:hypothetical protein
VLTLVVVAATTGNQQRFEGFRFRTQISSNNQQGCDAN